MTYWKLFYLRLVGEHGYHLSTNIFSTQEEAAARQAALEKESAETYKNFHITIVFADA